MKKKYIYCPLIIKIVLTGGLIFLTDCEKDFFTSSEPVTDIEGNIYPSVKIGTQTWMGENLKTTKYKNGIPIPNVTDGFQWTVLKTGAFCYYDNSSFNKSIYGALYNWYTVSTGNLCPNGWHVPSATEWKTLEEFLGGSYDAGGRLKEKGTSHWEKPNYGGINSSGFSAIPAGLFVPVFSSDFSQFIDINIATSFWTSTEAGSQTAIERNLNSDDHVLGSVNAPKYSGTSVRCIKDN
jgi:uncharacterized protein (TIGR02145 family)